MCHECLLWRKKRRKWSHPWWKEWSKKIKKEIRYIWHMKRGKKRTDCQAGRGELMQPWNSEDISFFFQMITEWVSWSKVRLYCLPPAAKVSWQRTTVVSRCRGRRPHSVMHCHSSPGSPQVFSRRHPLLCRPPLPVCNTPCDRRC